MHVSHSVGVLIATAAIAFPALADTPTTLTRVLLSAGGVAYLEREARVEGTGPVVLTVPRDLIDDVLKSLVVYDDAGGVSAIDLPGEEPLEAVFRQLPFPPAALASPAALLQSLKGAEVAIDGPLQSRGRVLSVVEETSVGQQGASVTRNRVTLLTTDGMASFILEEASGLRFTNPDLDSQVHRALTAMATLSDGKRRTLTVRLTGTAPRTVRLGYVVQAPLWKATYRLTLPQSESAHGDLQGWAVLENLSGEDWKSVDLSVVSGDPVTFRQNLYAPTYVERPTVPVDEASHVLPAVDERAMARAFKAAPPSADSAAGGPVMAMAPAAPVAAQAEQSTTQVAFHAPAPVTLANGSSLLMPIVTGAVSAERVDLFNEATHPRHPLAAVRLTNDTGSGLPPGGLSLYERNARGEIAFVGDARLPALPPEESRFLSFAVDQAVTIDRSEDAIVGRTTITAADGVVSVAVAERQTTTYAVAGAATDTRRVVIEHPRLPGWDVIAPAGSIETTQQYVRFALTVPGGGRTDLTVIAEHPRFERLELGQLTDERLAAFVTDGALPAAARDAFTRLGQLRAAVTDAERHRTGLEEERKSIADDQERLRQNLAALPRSGELRTRTLTRMAETETQLTRLAADLADARRAIDTAQSAVAKFVRELKL